MAFFQKLCESCDDIFEIFMINGCEQVRFFEIALGIFMTTEPLCKRISQIKNRPIMTALLCRNFKFIDSGSKAKLIGFIIHTENDPLRSRGIRPPRNGNIITIGYDQAFNFAHGPTPFPVAIACWETTPRLPIPNVSILSSPFATP